MKKRLTSPAYYFGWICIALMAYLIYLNVAPYWTMTVMDILNGSEENNYMVTMTASIQEIIWFPKPTHTVELEALKAGVVETLSIKAKEFDLKDFISMPILAFLGSFVGIVISFIMGHKWIASIAPIVCGAAGWIAFSSNTMLLLNTESVQSNLTGPHKLVSILLLAAGVVHLILALIPEILKAIKKKKAVAA